MPRLVRLYIHHVFIGFGLGLVFTALLLWLNVANLWHLVSTSDVGLMAAGMLVFFNGLVFASVQFAYVIMTMPTDDDDTRGKRDPVEAMEAAPAVATAPAVTHPQKR